VENPVLSRKGLQQKIDNQLDFFLLLLLLVEQVNNIISEQMRAWPYLTLSRLFASTLIEDLKPLNQK